VVARGKGLRRTWPAALVAGSTFALSQFLVSNLWGPYAADVIAASASIAASVAFLRVWAPSGANQRPSSDASPVSLAASRPATLSLGQVFAAWLPWGMLSAVMILWSYLGLLQKGQIAIPIPSLHNGVFITLYQSPTRLFISSSLLGQGLRSLSRPCLPRCALECAARSS
jgi:lactate permease